MAQQTDHTREDPNMAEIRDEVLERYGEELPYAQRALLRRFRAAVADATLGIYSEERNTALNALYQDQFIFDEPERHVRVLIDWAAAADQATLAQAAFWFFATIQDQTPVDTVGMALRCFYETLGVPSYAEAEQSERASAVRLVWVDEDDDLHVGTVIDLSVHIHTYELGAGVPVAQVYTADRGELVKVEHKTASVINHEEQTARVTLTVALPDARTASHSWTDDLAV